jgi:hypothetical protein
LPRTRSVHVRRGPHERRTKHTRSRKFRKSSRSSLHRSCSLFCKRCERLRGRVQTNTGACSVVAQA